MEIPTREADELIGARHGTVMQAIQSGELPAFHKGKRYRVDVDELFHWWKKKRRTRGGNHESKG